MQKSTAIGISIPIAILERIDQERGDVSRSKYILRKLGLVNSKNQKNMNSIRTPKYNEPARPMSDLLSKEFE